jgi:hypothetical protein
VDRTAAFVNERRYLLRETVAGNAWLSPAVHAGLALVCALWALAFVVAVRGLSDDDERRTRDPAPAATPGVVPA